LIDDYLFLKCGCGFAFDNPKFSNRFGRWAGANRTDAFVKMAIFDATDANKTYFRGFKLVVAVAADTGVGFGEQILTHFRVMRLIAPLFAIGNSKRCERFSHRYVNLILFPCY